MVSFTYHIFILGFVLARSSLNDLFGYELIDRCTLVVMCWDFGSMLLNLGPQRTTGGLTSGGSQLKFMIKHLSMCIPRRLCCSGDYVTRGRSVPPSRGGIARQILLELPRGSSPALSEAGPSCRDLSPFRSKEDGLGLMGSPTQVRSFFGRCASAALVVSPIFLAAGIVEPALEVVPFGLRDELEVIAAQDDLWSPFPMLHTVSRR